MTLMRYQPGFSAASPQDQQTASKAATAVGIVGALAGVPVVGPIAALGAALFSIFGKSTKVLTEQEILNAVTPTVVNDLQNAGYTLPPGEEQSYVKAALSGQVPEPQVNYVVPLGIGAVALWVLLS